MRPTASGGAHGDAGAATVLWSAATAREIIAEISRDIECGRTTRVQGVDLIHRVWARAAPIIDPCSPRWTAPVADVRVRCAPDDVATAHPTRAARLITGS